MGGTVLDENGNRIKVNIEEPRWDQTTYWGRARHFFTTANPINVFATPGQLDHANEIVTKYRKVIFEVSKAGDLFKKVKINMRIRSAA